MKKRSFNLRNVVKTVACLAVTSMMFMGCDPDESNNNGNNGGNETTEDFV